MILYFISLVLAFVAQFTSLRFFELLAIICAAFMLLVRDGVGYDYYNYVRIFEYDITFTLAPVSNFLQDAARELRIPNGFMGLAAILTAILLVYMSRINARPRLSLIIFFAFPFFFLESFSIVRQILAVLVAALSYQLLRNQKYLGSLVVSIISAGIHPSAILSLPFFLLVNPNINWKYLNLFPLMFAAAYFMSDFYLSSELAQVYGTLDIAGNYYHVVTGVVLVVAYLLKDRELIVCAILGFAFSILNSMFGNYVLNRLIVYFYIPFMFAPLNFRRFTKSLRISVIGLLIIFLYIAAFQIKLNDENNRLIPYEAIIKF